MHGFLESIKKFLIVMSMVTSLAFAMQQETFDWHEVLVPSCSVAAVEIEGFLHINPLGQACEIRSYMVRQKMRGLVWRALAQQRKRALNSSDQNVKLTCNDAAKRIQKLERQIKSLSKELEELRKRKDQGEREFQAAIQKLVNEKAVLRDQLQAKTIWPTKR